MSKDIKSSVENIRATDEQRDRMLANIYDKAENKSEAQARSGIRLSQIAVPIAACVCIAVFGVYFLANRNTPKVDTSSSDAPASSVGDIAPSPPFREVSDASAFSEIGITIDAPEGAEDKSYMIYDGNMAEVNFSYGGLMYYIRASKQQGDFSGQSFETSSEEQIDAENSASFFTLRTEDEVSYRLEWTDGAVRYMLCSPDQTDKAKMTAVYNKIK